MMSSSRPEDGSSNNHVNDALNIQQNNVSIQELEESLCCPITESIFLLPVTLLPSGHTVERDSADELIRLNQNYPSQTDIITGYARNWAMQQTVDKYLEANPGAKERQYRSPVQQAEEKNDAGQIVDNNAPQAIPQAEQLIEEDNQEDAQEIQQVILAQGQLALAANQNVQPLIDVAEGKEGHQQGQPELQAEMKNDYPAIRLPVVVGIDLSPFPVSSSSAGLQNLRRCKGILLGSSDAGKGAFLSALTEESFSAQFMPTIGIDFKTLIEGDVRYQIYDTAGHERFRTTSAPYYRGARFILFFGDNADEVNHSVTHVTNEHQTTLKFYRISYDSQSATISLVPYESNVLADHMRLEGAPLTIAPQFVRPVGVNLLAQIVRQMPQQQAAANVPQVEQNIHEKKKCSIM